MAKKVLIAGSHPLSYSLIKQYEAKGVLVVPHKSMDTRGISFGSYIGFAPIHFLRHRVANFSDKTLDWPYIPSMRLSPHVPMSTILQLNC